MPVIYLRTDIPAGASAAPANTGESREQRGGVSGKGIREESVEKNIQGAKRGEAPAD